MLDSCGGHVVTTSSGMWQFRYHQLSHSFLSVLKMGVVVLFETLVPIYQTTYRDIREDERHG